MKRFIVALVICLAMIAVMVTPAMAVNGDSNSNGAVKVDLVQNPFTGGKCVVGSAVINTTGNGRINVEVNIDELPDLCEWDVRVFVCDKLIIDGQGVLNTNAQGEGNVHLQGCIPECCLDGDCIEVEVNIGPSLPTYPPPYGIICGSVCVPVK